MILEARWAKYAEGTSFGNEPHGHVVLSDSGGSDPTDNHAVFARGLERTIRALASKKIVLVADVPEVGWPVPARLAREALARHRLTTATSENVYLQRQKFVLATFARLQKLYGVGVLYPHAVLCRDGKCAVALDGVPLYRDEHHLSVYGARRLTALMARAFGSAS